MSRAFGDLESYTAFVRRRAENFRQHVVGARIEDVSVFHEYEAADDTFNAGIEFTITCADGERLRMTFVMSDFWNEPQGTVDLDDMPDAPMTADKGCLSFVADAGSDDEAIRRLYAAIQAEAR